MRDCNTRELSPTNLISSEEQNGIQLAWTEPARDADDITGYQVLRRIPSEGEDTLAVHDTTTGQDTSYLDTTALTQGTKYVYRVKANRPSGTSSQSNYTNLTRETQGTAPDSPAPTPVPNTPTPVPEPTFSPPAHMTSVWWKYDECGCYQYRPSQTIKFEIHTADHPALYAELSPTGSNWSRNQFLWTLQNSLPIAAPIRDSTPVIP